MILALHTSGLSNMKTKHTQTETSPGNCVALAIQRRPSPGAGKPLQRHFHRRSLLTACHSLSRQVGCLVAAGLLQAGVASAVDDHGDTMATATAINFPSTTPGAINQAGDLDYFRFALSSTTNIIATSSGATDTYGDLLNSGGSVLVSNDDGAGAMNFRITKLLNAGTYYIRVRHYDGNGSGAYQLNLGVNVPISTADPRVYALVPGGTVYISDGSRTTLARQNTRFITTTPGGYKDHSFQINNGGGGILTLTGVPAVTITGPGASQFRVVTQPAKTIGSGKDTAFVIRFQPTLPGEHSATVSFTSNCRTPAYSPYTFDIKGAGPDIPDDHGDTPETATQVDIPCALSSVKSYGSDVDVFEFTTNETSDVDIYTASDYGWAPDIGLTPLSSQQSITNFVGVPTDDWNHHFKCRLSPGTYYLHVTNSSRTDLGVGKSVPVVVNVSQVTTPDIRVLQSSMRVFNGGRGVGEYVGGQYSGPDSVSFWVGQCQRDFEFQIENAGDPELQLTGTPIVTLSGPGASQYSILSQPSVAVLAPRQKTSFRLRWKPTIAGTQTATISIASSDPDEGLFSFFVSNTSYTPTVDAQGNSLETAAFINAIPANIPSIFDYSGDVDWFRFDLAEPSTVRIKSTGMDDPFGTGDLYGELFNAAGTQIAYNDDEPWSLNFLMQRSLSAGTYYIKVSRGGSRTAYRLVLDYVN